MIGRKWQKQRHLCVGLVLILAVSTISRTKWVLNWTVSTEFKDKVKNYTFLMVFGEKKQKINAINLIVIRHEYS